VVTLQPVDAAEKGLVRPPRAAEHVEDRQPDRDRDAGQHAEQRHAAKRRDRQQELGLALAPASGRIVAAIIGPREESGPSTRIRDGPNTA
jgi:hypothetical protein